MLIKYIKTTSSPIPLINLSTTKPTHLLLLQLPNMEIGEMSFRELPYNSDDGEEAPLSPSHLPLKSNSSDWDQDFFEFSSEDFSASSDDSNAKDSIVFCGKIIPYREAQVMETNNRKSKPKKAGKRSSWLLFTWRSDVNKSRTSTNEDGKVVATRKVQVLSSPLKSRWYLFAFGVGRFPMAEEHSDMKIRQSRKRTAKYPNIDRREMSYSSSSSGSRSDGNVSTRDRDLWSFLNNLGCRN